MSNSMTKEQFERSARGFIITMLMRGINEKADIIATRDYHVDFFPDREYTSGQSYELTKMIIDAFDSTCTKQGYRSVNATVFSYPAYDGNHVCVSLRMIDYVLSPDDLKLDTKGGDEPVDLLRFYHDLTAAGGRCNRDADSPTDTADPEIEGQLGM